MNKITNWKRAILVALALFVPAISYAHTGSGTGVGFSHGIWHPLTGLDHILAMLAVGIWALHAGGRSLWALPAAFVGLMLVGAALAINGIMLPGIEQAILLSVVVLGCVIALGVRLPVVPGMAVVGLFGIFHGFAHGMELMLPAGAASYAFGFAVMTVILHLGGLLLGYLLQRRRVEYLRIAGSAVAAAGLALAVV